MSDWQPKIVVFLCQWSLKADHEWQQRFELPPHVRVVEVPCSGRVNPLLLVSALQHGADGILVVGCEPGHCHYKNGNYLGRRKYATLESFLQYLGLERDRLQVAFLDETEGSRFRVVVQDLLDKVRALGPADALAMRQPIACLSQAEQE